MLDQLSERLQGVLNPLKFGQSLTLENMDEALREIRRALLEADVSLRAVKAFLTRVQESAEGQAIIKSVNPAQQLVKIVHDELVTLLGREHQPLNLTDNPALIMMLGLQGSGKTTTAAKLALKLKQDQKSPLLIAADVYRPAAVEQLITLGKGVDVPVYSEPGSTDVLAIVEAGIQEAKANHHNVVIIDTAGRLQVDTAMMAELLLIDRKYQPAEKLLVIDAMTGQEAVNVAEAFNTQLTVTGIVLTKLDGDSRGGAALSVVETTGKPIKWVGVSEKMSGLEPFHPDRMAGRILGMGDVVSLVEKAQQAMDEAESQKLEAKIRSQTFSFEDFLKIQKQLKMLGGLEGILTMLPIPGIDKNMREMIGHSSEGQFKRIQSMIQSMTAEERDNSDLMKQPKRITRIAKGSGIPETEVKQFVQQFEQMKMMMKQLTRFTDDAKKESERQPGQGASAGLHMPRKMKNKKQRDPFSALGKKLKGKFPGKPGGLPKDLSSGLPGGLPGEMGGGGWPPMPPFFGR